MEEGFGVEQLIERIDDVIKILDRQVRPDIHGDCEEIAFAALKLASMAGELECVGDDAALIAEGLRFLARTGSSARGDSAS